MAAASLALADEAGLLPDQDAPPAAAAAVGQPPPPQSTATVAQAAATLVTLQAYLGEVLAHCTQFKVTISVASRAIQ